MRHRLALLAVVALAVAACSGEAQAGPGRLVVHDLAGTIRVLEPDGTVVEEVAAATDGERHAQPVWSADGATVAWVAATPDATSLRLTTDDGTRSIPLPGGAFYLSWAPDGHRLLVLGGAPTGGVAASVVETDDGAVVPLGVDRPWYAAWSPDSDALLVRRGPAGLAVVDAEGSGETTIGTGAPFQAPDWSADGRRAYAEAVGSRSRVVVDGGPSVDVVAGLLAFDLGRDLAYQALVDADGIQVAYRQVEAGRTNALVVVDASGTQTTVWPTPVLGFAWSPDGSKLLFLTPEQERVAWRTWDGETVTDLFEAAPTRLFVGEYLPFFDQYARSQTFWSPGSDAVAIPGVVDGSPGIWVVEPGGDPVRVADGEMVSWGRSP